MVDVNKNIEKVRLSKGITRKFVAKKCGKTQQWYWKVEKGLIIPDAVNLQLIAKALEVDVKIFFENKLNDTLNTKLA
ncbi:helix-turn-helix domain-containing protein [Lysinibacillus halotolerans]|uniref:helix-turn-helix domain-containing protein n=1 Tax=Lysinibacillus halotolerans TaxID=1368476 RepID=UPI00131460D4|nr:helix-turn-helix transcriptional regulator [Lysinibacillus halotolerans]